ncbi:MAG: response regulator [Bacteroidota bacterium]
MNLKAANTAKPVTIPVSQKDKDAAKMCLVLADKFLKESSFVQARAEVAKAQKLDPTNPYAYAFLDRITYFEEQKKKEAPSPEAAAPPVPQEIEPPRVEPKGTQVSPPPKQPEPKTESVPPKPGSPPQIKKESIPPPVEKRQDSPPPARPIVPLPTSNPTQRTAPADVQKAKPENIVEASRSVIADVIATRGKPPAPNNPPGIADMLNELSQASQQHAPNAPRGDVDSKLDEMKRQIEMLTKSLEQERVVREEMNQQQLKGAIKQVRTTLEKAWANGAPKDAELEKLHDLAVSLGIPEDVIHTLNREVKLDMYSRAVKEVVAKQNLLRNSSRTLEWLRKVYSVSLDEYLEYESKFLMDLVADQYKGTILLVSGEEKSPKDIGQKLKSMGYAVVNASSPENALEKIEKINPHFILCDMEFSQGYLSGIKFLHVLRANSKFSYIPFILLCQPNEVSQFNSSDLRPTEGFIEKPFEMETLNAVMNEKLMAFRQYLSSL